jgi:hypothetical protein
MTTFITLPYPGQDAFVSTDAIAAVEDTGTDEYVSSGARSRVHLIGGSIIQSTLWPSEVLDLVEAAMHPTTETETR